MIKSPVFLAVVLLLSTLVAVGYQAFELNKIRLRKELVVSEPVKTKPVAAGNNIPNLTQLAKRNVMGNPQKSQQKSSAEKTIPITAMKLTLIGTIIKTAGGVSSALIQGSNRETKRYFVGEMVESGFILDSVAVNSVVLKRDDQLETLQYPANTSTAPAVTSVMGPVSPPVVNRPVQPNSPATGPQADANHQLQQSLRNRLRRGSPATNP